MAAKQALYLLDLYSLTYDTPPEQVETFKCIVNTAYEEGRLAQMEEERESKERQLTDLICKIKDGKDNII